MIGFDRAVEDADVTGGVALYLLKIVSDDDDQLVAGDFTKKLDDLLRGLTVQISRRLIAEKNGGILGQGAGDDGPLLLTARELASLVVDVPLQTHTAQELHSPIPTLTGIFDVHKGQLHVLEDGEALNDVVLLEDEGYVLLAVLLPVLLEEVGRGLALNAELALLVGVHAADDVEQGGFTRPRFTRHSDELPTLKGQIDSSDTDGDVALGYVDLTDVLQFQ